MFFKLENLVRQAQLVDESDPQFSIVVQKKNAKQIIPQINRKKSQVKKPSENHHLIVTQTLNEQMTFGDEEVDNVFTPIMDKILDMSDNTDHSFQAPKLQRSDSRKSIVLLKDIDYLENRMMVKDYCRHNYTKNLQIGKNTGKKPSH